MNDFTVVLFIILIVSILVYYIVKGHYVNQMTKAIKNKNYQDVLTLSRKSLLKKFMGNYNCTLYRLRALSNMGKDVEFKYELDLEIEEAFPDSKHKDLLVMYFHYFLIKKDREYAEKLLEDIRNIGEPTFSVFHEKAFDIMINNSTAYIASMEDDINSKRYSGFELGVLVYMIGMQYLILDNKDEARTYFYNSLSCFHPNAVYVSCAKKYVNDLSDELELERPNY